MTDTPGTGAPAYLPFIDHPTITLYRDQLQRFNETLRQCLAFIEEVTSLPAERQTPADLCAWLATNVSPAAAARYDQLGYYLLSGQFNEECIVDD